jgi:hypothetical protein
MKNPPEIVPLSRDMVIHAAQKRQMTACLHVSWNLYMHTPSLAVGFSSVLGEGKGIELPGSLSLAGRSVFGISTQPAREIYWRWFGLLTRETVIWPNLDVSSGAAWRISYRMRYQCRFVPGPSWAKHRSLCLARTLSLALSRSKTSKLVPAHQQYCYTSSPRIHKSSNPPISIQGRLRRGVGPPDVTSVARSAPSVRSS